jgi:hypothetical protein
MKKPNRPTEVAYHEAGHAAVRIYMELPFDRVSIISEGNSAGRIEHPVVTDPLGWEELLPDEIDLLIDRHVASIFAGPLAQERLSGNYDADGANSDHKDMIDFISRRCHSDDEMEAYFAWMQIRTRNIVNMCWLQIDAIAQALLEEKELSADEVLEIARRPI